MQKRIVTIALDAMGGSGGCKVAVEGAALTADQDARVRFLFFGDEQLLNPLISKHKVLQERCEVYHTTEVVSDDDKPSDAIRNRKNSSMRLAINAVHEGRADAAVSSGNTGALMGISKFVLKTIRGIKRPAIITGLPTRSQNLCCCLDLGANAECTKENLLQFAIMGNAYAKSYLNIKFPRIGLLNMGAEALKGSELVQETATLIEDYGQLNYQGFAEGDDIFSGNYDVVVTDGFTGNIALKVLEGTVSFVKYTILSLAKNSWFIRLLVPFFGVILFFVIKKFKKLLDARNYNGAMLIGLNGIVIKSHGSADSYAFANAIKVASILVSNDVNAKIKNELQHSLG